MKLASTEDVLFVGSLLMFAFVVWWGVRILAS
jgi:hypothetical protein